MKLSEFLTLKAIISFVYALGALIVPGLLLVYHGRPTDDMGQVLARYFGAMLFGIGLLCWSIKSLEDSETRRSILLALFIADALGLVIALIAQFTLALSVLGWVDIAIWVILVLGLGYYRFLQSPGTQTQS